MRCLTVIRALLVRLLFAGHGLMAIWRLYMVKDTLWCWYLSGAIGGLFIETIVTLCMKRGKEWKWFCPSVFFYLASVVPAIWFLELHDMEERIFNRESFNVTRSKSNNTEDLSVNIEGLGLQIHIPLALSADLWLRVLEQFLLLMLIIGRWLLPKGALSHDQLSQLLLVYVGTAADIVEFYEAFNEEGVKYNRLLCFIILGIWTLSLMQFTLVLTATRARRDQAEGRSRKRKRKQEGSPGLQRLRMYDNNHMGPRGNHDGRKRIATSNSSPCVYKSTESLGRNKNICVRDRRSEPTGHLRV